MNPVFLLCLERYVSEGRYAAGLMLRCYARGNANYVTYGCADCLSDKEDGFALSFRGLKAVTGGGCANGDKYKFY